MLNEDSIEKFIRENRSQFTTYEPPSTHSEKFIMKLKRRIRKVISIVPYLIRVAVVTVVIFTASIIIWDNYIRKDRNEITLCHKISVVFSKIKPA